MGCFIACELGECSHKCFLSYIFCFCNVPEHTISKILYRIFIALDENREDILIAFEDERDKGNIAQRFRGCRCPRSPAKRLVCILYPCGPGHIGGSYALAARLTYRLREIPNSDASQRLRSVYCRFHDSHC